MNRAFIEANRTKFESIPGIKFVSVFNDQIEKMRKNANQDAKNPDFDFLKPAILFEIVAPTPIDQLLGGFQLYDNLIVRVHLIHEEYDAGDGKIDQNLNVYDLKQTVFAEIDRFQPDGASPYIRRGEIPDYNHGNIYVFSQDWETTFIDSQNQTPFGVKQPPTELEIAPITVIKN